MSLDIIMTHISNIDSRKVYIIYKQYGGKKWTSLVHNGVLFPEPYKMHNIPVIYDGKKIYDYFVYKFIDKIKFIFLIDITYSIIFLK